MPYLGATVAVDGPAPRAPRYSLIQAAELVTDDELPAGAGRPDAERFAGGVSVYPYPCGPDAVFDQCNPTNKSFSGVGPVKDISAMMSYVASTCTTRSINDYDDFKARALAVFLANEAFSIEREFWDGALLPLNPHLTQAAAAGQVAPNVLNAGGAAATATGPVNGLALLEKAIGSSGTHAFIHMSPGAADACWSQHLLIEDGNRGVRTRNGNTVVIGGGYSGNAPSGFTANAGAEEFIMATGPIALRQGKVFVLPGTPEDFASAIDRTLNNARFYVERPNLVLWDQCLFAGVRVDRCKTTC